VRAEGGRLQQSINSLPPSSTVRQDIIAAAIAEERRIERERMLDGIPLEQQNARDDNLVNLANEAMRHKEGHIEYREHLLPLHEGELERQLTVNVRVSHEKLPATVHLCC
jgi:hypothetical protein